MSFTFGFHNSKNGDRKYNSKEMSEIFNGIIKDGVFMSIGQQFRVLAQSGLTVTIGTGRLWFHDTWALNDALYPITLPQAEMLQPVYYAIVHQVDHTEAVRANSFKYVKGTPALNPVKPTLLNGPLVYQNALAYIKLPANATAITQAMIENAVGFPETPFVSGILETVDTEMLLAQWTAEWKAWREDWLEWWTGQNGGAEGYMLQNIYDNERYVMGRGGIKNYVEGKFGTPLTSGQNLNSVKSTGFYYAETDAIVASLVNCPVQYAFSMLVEKDGQAWHQTITILTVPTPPSSDITTIKSSTYKRSEFGPVGWGAWRRMSFEPLQTFLPTYASNIVSTSVGRAYRKNSDGYVIFSDTIYKTDNSAFVASDNVNIMTFPTGYIPFSRAQAIFGRAYNITGATIGVAVLMVFTAPQGNVPAGGMVLTYAPATTTGISIEGTFFTASPL